ncbi:MAG: QueG-associated DUF1730 domain-containing protein [Cyanobacteriota bacterium]
MNKKELTEKIKEYSKEKGFELVGITDSKKVEDISFYNSWIESGFAGDMDYLKRNIEKRENPELLFPNTKTIICFGYNYFTDYKPTKLKVAKYALNNDYHDFLKKKSLKSLNI